LFAELILVQVKFPVKNLGSMHWKRSHKVTLFHELFLTVASCM